MNVADIVAQVLAKDKAALDRVKAPVVTVDTRDTSREWVGYDNTLDTIMEDRNAAMLIRGTLHECKESCSYAHGSSLRWEQVTENVHHGIMNGAVMYVVEAVS